MLENISEVYKTKDTIFHYTTSLTALENILFKKQLRLSPRNMSNDPLEKAKESISESIVAFPEDMESLEEQTKGVVEEILDLVKNKQDKIRQVCFCMNSKNIKSIDDLGFMRSRMWDQYGDKYKGVCLAFSKKELLKNQKIKLKNFVGYKKFNEFPTLEIDCNDILAKGPKKYKKDFMRDIDASLFFKHKDYRDENEYRLCTYSEDGYDYINFENSLKGIIVSLEHISEFTWKMLINYSKHLKVDLFYVSWRKHSIRIDRERHSPNFEIIPYYK